jgi:hypothetical protein
MVSMSGERRSASSSVDCKESGASASVTAASPAAATKETTNSAATAATMTANANNGLAGLGAMVRGTSANSRSSAPASSSSEQTHLYHEESPNHIVYRKVSTLLLSSILQAIGLQVATARPSGIVSLCIQEAIFTEGRDRSASGWWRPHCFMDSGGVLPTLRHRNDTLMMIDRLYNFVHNGMVVVY